MITRTTQETLRLQIGDREYVGWIDEHDDCWLTYGAGTPAEIHYGYNGATEHIRGALILQALTDADNPHRDDVQFQFPVTSTMLAVA